MMGMTVLAICGLPPLAHLVVAATGLSAGRLAVVLPLAVSAAVLALPLMCAASVVVGRLLEIALARTIARGRGHRGVPA